MSQSNFGAHGGTRTPNIRVLSASTLPNWPTWAVFATGSVLSAKTFHRVLAFWFCCNDPKNVWWRLGGSNP